MNMKNVIKRAGVIFILGPIFIIAIIANIAIWLTIMFWGPFYYIITGKDPLGSALYEELDGPFYIAFNVSDWYLNKFGPHD